MFRPGKDRFLGLGVAAVDKWLADATAQSSGGSGPLIRSRSEVGVAIANLRLRLGSFAQRLRKATRPAPAVSSPA